MTWRTHAVAFLVGAVMATSLVAAHVTDPRMVLGFLDVFGQWNPAIAYFMVGSIASFSVVYRLVRPREVAVLGDEICVPSSSAIDARMVGGAAVFGVGWGLTGLCPGPAIASIATGGVSILAFVAAMAAAMLIVQPTFTRRAARSAT
ncbi:MAG: DUF6691 family protein [Myxococcota bacterium]